VNVGLTPEDLVGRGTADGELAPFAVLSARPEPPGGRADFAPSKPQTAGEPTEPTAERLAERSKAGCLESFEQLVARYESPIFNFLRQFTGNHHDAEDLTQETFVKAYRSLHRFDSSFSFAAWLFTIARRTGASHFRSARRFAELPAAEEGTQESPATALECKDEQNSIWKLVWTLKPKQAEALWLRYAEGFSIAETAGIMRTNQIHVKVLLHRARSRLSRIITTRKQVLQASTDLRAEEIGSRQGLEKQKAFL
jgi:RNA polymerase sigma-70 factor (ECF subfamily)